ncbi:hypothetical protein [Actinomadura meyerae]|nr:hypothetical protein [Actinomadura meyerae]
MADEKEVDGRDKLDAMATNLARGRVALGVAAFAAPGLTVKLMGMGGGSDPGRDYMVRMFAAREIALGAGYLLSDGPARKLWGRLGLLADSLDVVNGLKTRKALPLWVTAGAVGVAGAAAGIGAAKAGTDIVR